jgi:hypothetical protein
MPREKINDERQNGMYVQVSWRRHDEVPDFDAPGHVQVAAINECADAMVRELLNTADVLLGDVPADVAPPEWRAAVNTWRRLLTQNSDWLTGWYVSLNDESTGRALRTLHKARAQAYPRNGLPAAAKPNTLD